MLLKKILLLLILFLAVPLSAGVYEIQGHNRDAYLETTDILLQELQEDPENLELRERVIRFYYATELFDEAVRHCEIYKQKSAQQTLRNRGNEQRIDYTRILSLASSSRYGEAVSAVDRYISDYNPSDNETAELRHRQSIYRNEMRTRAFPVVTETVAEKKRVLGLLPGSDGMILYNSENDRLEYSNPRGGAVRPGSMPAFQNKDKILNVAFNRQADICCVSYRSNTGAYIEVSYKTGAEWTPLRREGELNAGNTNSFPSFFPDGRTILFCSNRADDSGLDIYSSKYLSSSWTEARAVSGINSSKDEASVTVRPEGNSIFFSTNGRPGLGGFDLYSARIEQSGSGYAASDIKHIASLNTFKNEIDPPYISESNRVAVYAHTAEETSTLHLLHTSLFDAVPIEAAPITTGTFVASDIQFDIDSTILRSSSYTYLERLYEYLQNNPDKQVTIAGHTDNTGTEEYNQSLSQRRAQAVRDYLVRRGIASSRITVKGYGTSKPVAQNETEGGRQKNRRVEITISD